VGAGCPIDPARHAILAPNLIGSCYGTSRPRTADGRRARVSPRDMARLVRPLLDVVGARSVALATGGSLGGMVALEWAASFPALTQSVVAFAAPAAHTAQGIGWNHVQRRAIELGGEEGLALARMTAMLTYRTAGELETRFGRELRDDGRFQVQSYLSYQGEKLLRRFDAESYLSLIDAMDAHDVGRGRGGVAAALGAFQGKLFGVGIPGDLLYTPEDVLAWVHPTGAEYREIRSPHGHDAFLLERAQAANIVTEALEWVEGKGETA
jgi:homoserine O-acetyltransferase